MSNKTITNTTNENILVREQAKRKVRKREREKEREDCGTMKQTELVEDEMRWGGRKEITQKIR